MHICIHTYIPEQAYAKLARRSGDGAAGDHAGEVAAAGASELRLPNKAH